MSKPININAAAVRAVWAFMAIAFLWCQPVSADRADPLRVAVSIPPLHSLVAALLPDGAEAELLMPAGATPHRYALKPSQARALATADLVVWIGPQLEGFLVRPIANLPKAARIIAMADAPGLVRRPFRVHRHGGHEGHGHHGDHGSAEGRGVHLAEAHGGHGALDPHLWLDPKNAQAMAAAVVRALARLDPVNAAAYRKNLTRLGKRLARLETDMSQRLAPVKGAGFAVFHDAYQYFEARFGLKAEAAIAVDAERPPGAAHVRALRRRFADDAVRCLFTEPQFPPKLARTLVEGTRVRLAVLDPLGSGFTPGRDLYFDLMQRNAAAAADCLKP